MYLPILRNQPLLRDSSYGRRKEKNLRKKYSRYSSLNVYLSCTLYIFCEFTELYSKVWRQILQLFSYLEETSYYLMKVEYAKDKL